MGDHHLFGPSDPEWREDMLPALGEKRYLDELLHHSQSDESHLGTYRPAVILELEDEAA